MLELHHNNVFVELIVPGGWFTLPNGDRVSPAVAGWSNAAGYSLIEHVPPAPPPYVPTVNDVINERRRRLALGFDYDFADARGIHRIGTTEADMLGWREVTDACNAAINSGAGTTTLDIVTNTGPATITATEWQAILLAASQFRQPIWAASFKLQAMVPIPDDYASDIHWPA